MATIAAKSDISILKISGFLGLNENPDGDTTLKVGEMAEMRNFRITRDKHLQIRPGTKTLLRLSDAAQMENRAGGQDGAATRLWGVWRGSVGEQYHTLAAYGGYVWDVDPEGGTAVSKGSVTEDATTFFGFGGKVYLLNGHEYMSWDGGAETAFQTVEGYVPLVQTATTPQGGGTLVEAVNRLNGKRRVEFSPDGSATTFQLPEKNIDAVVEVTKGGAAVSGYTPNLTAGTVKFSSAPAKGTNTVTVTYRKGDGERQDVERMRYCELYNGSTDTRVFLYGDGSSRAIYSGVRYDTGLASAEYFPDLYEVTVGESNTPITALVRHYAKLMAFKPDSAWYIQHGTVTLDDGAATPAFYVTPLNRQFGNEVPGQAKLLENSPLTIDTGGIYHWQTNGYTSVNESNARRISDRVGETMESFRMKDVRTFNIKGDHEYWFLCDGRALILNYANDTWYLYEGLPFSALLEVDGEKYGFCDDGRVVKFSREYRNDDGKSLDCYAATGAMDFGKDWLLKYSPVIYVAMQPENNARVYVTVETNRRSDYPEKLAAHSLSTFSHVDFGHFSFSTSRKPQVRRIRMKVKKAAFYRLIFKSNSASATGTVIETDVQLRYAGNVK